MLNEKGVIFLQLGSVRRNCQSIDSLQSLQSLDLCDFFLALDKAFLFLHY